jgi:hypothetical protein
LSCGYDCGYQYGHCTNTVSNGGQYGYCDASEGVFQPKSSDVVVAIEGSWVSIGSSSNSGSFETTSGTVLASTVSSTSSYSSSITRTMEEGYSFWVSVGIAGYAGYASKKVGRTTSRTTAQTYSRSFTEFETETMTFDFDAGVVWQWQFSITDGCGKVSTVKTRDVVQTASQGRRPCCMPGYFLDPAAPHGDCEGDLDGEVTNFCGTQDSAVGNQTAEEGLGPHATCPPDAPPDPARKGRYGTPPSPGSAARARAHGTWVVVASTVALLAQL